jgi:hypothetical protein
LARLGHRRHVWVDGRLVRVDGRLVRVDGRLVQVERWRPEFGGVQLEPRRQLRRWVARATGTGWVAVLSARARATAAARLLVRFALPLRAAFAV